MSHPGLWFHNFWIGEHLAPRSPEEWSPLSREQDMAPILGEPVSGVRSRGLGNTPLLRTETEHQPRCATSAQMCHFVFLTVGVVQGGEQCDRLWLGHSGSGASSGEDESQHQVGEGEQRGGSQVVRTKQQVISAPVSHPPVGRL